MDAHITRQLGVEGGGEQRPLPDRDDPTGGRLGPENLLHAVIAIGDVTSQVAQKELAAGPRTAVPSGRTDSIWWTAC